MPDLSPIDPFEMLQDISTELYMALNNGALIVGNPVDPIDRQHVENAYMLLRALRRAQRKQPISAGIGYSQANKENAGPEFNPIEALGAKVEE